MKRLLLVVLSWGLVVLFAVALLVRLTVKDGLPVLATVYYATPVTVLAAIVGLAGFFWWLSGRPKRALLSLLATVLCVVWWPYCSYFDNSGSRSEADTSVVFWNVARGRFGWTGIIETLTRSDPDIVGLVEVRGADAESRRFWQEAFPHHDVSNVEGGMLLICRGRIREISSGPLRRGGNYRHAKIETNSEVLNVVIIDIHSDPLMHRREPIEQIAAITSTMNDEPTLVMGDFNTPGDSIHFDILRPRFANAFETRGQGFSATWPLPLPVLQLDHIWADRRVGISECKTEWTWHSDHRPISTWLKIRSQVSR